jgi:flagellar protein FliO/FliZ
MPSVGLSVLWFLAILALIPVSLWWIKRTPMGAALGAGVGQPVKPVASLALGPGQRVVTVEVGQGDARTWLVLGVTAGSINLLHTLPPQAAPAEAAPVGPFAALLRKKLGGPEA